MTDGTQVPTYTTNANGILIREQVPLLSDLPAEHRPTVTVRYDGKTDQHNYYPESWRRQEQVHRGKRTDGHCTVARTKYDARRIAEIHSYVAKASNQRCYLITHTTSPNFLGTIRQVGRPSETLIHRRRIAFRLFLDRLRKEPEYRGHFWTTEVHAGERMGGVHTGLNYGTIHHHVAVRMAGFWNWKPKVQQWSYKYCGSPNGLDIANPTNRPNAAWQYLSGAWGYLDLQDPETVLPFRWWGTSAIPRKWKQWSDETVLHMPPFKSEQPYRVRCAKVSKVEALIGACRIVIDKDQRTLAKELKKNIYLCKLTRREAQPKPPKPWPVNC